MSTPEKSSRFGGFSAFPKSSAGTRRPSIILSPPLLSGWCQMISRNPRAYYYRGPKRRLLQYVLRKHMCPDVCTLLRSILKGTGTAAVADDAPTCAKAEAQMVFLILPNVGNEWKND